MILNVVGARPNFMKMAPVILEMRRRGLEHLVVHTGQHYDSALSSVFLEELGLTEPDVSLGVGSGSHAAQTAGVLTAFEKVCRENEPDLVVVAGDVNSTLAAALAAAKLCIPVAHVEAGLRSHDRSMPEEVNRVLTDHISDLLFTTEPDGNHNLEREGIAAEKVHFVGNPMIDSLEKHVGAAVVERPWEKLSLEPRGYGLVTLHRPSNVDEPTVAVGLAGALARVAQDIPLVFPMHPRTRASSGHLWEHIPGLRIEEPFGYLGFIGLMAGARLVITDSGGIQEETTYLGIPCITVRPNTERPVTTSEGTNTLVHPDDPSWVIAAAHRIVQQADAPSSGDRSAVPELWDGHAGERIVDVIDRWLEGSR